MSKTSRVAACLLAALVFTPLTARAQDRAALDDALTSALKAAGTPGASVAVAKNGHIVLERAFGVKNLDSQAPVDAHTRFEIGSITKQFTAAAILQLKERGKLSLSDPLVKYVPQYAAGKNVTIEQLLWQVSGIPEYFTPGNLPMFTERKASLNAMLAIIKDKPLDFAPGTKWAYSNSNYFLLGRVVEVASGMPWRQYVRTQIFAPAGMTESSFMDDEGNIADMATGYTVKNENVVPAPSMAGWGSADGGIVSTAGDLVKWDNALLGGNIVSAADLRLMTESGRLTDGTSTGYGFAWMSEVRDGAPGIWHNGGTLGFIAKNEVFPQLGETIVILENNNNAWVSSVSGSLFAALNPQLAALDERPVSGENSAVTARAKIILQQICDGSIDRSQLSAAMNEALTPQMLSALGTRFRQLGFAQTWVYRGTKADASETAYIYRVTFTGGQKLSVTMTVGKDGKISDYSASPA